MSDHRNDWLSAGSTGSGIGRRGMLAGTAALLGGTVLPAALAAPAAATMPTMDARQAEQLARLSLSWIHREYPASPGLSRLGPDDPLSPRINHPVFYGGFDWSSSVANHWVIARLLRTHPDLTQSRDIAGRFDRVLSAENVAAEIGFFAKPDRQGFGRPVGWGYIMLISSEFERIGFPAERWRLLLQPLVDDLRRRTLDFLPKLRFAGRGGAMPAGFSMIVEYAKSHGDEELLAAIGAHARTWYADRVIDRVPQVGGEESMPGEWAAADLMRRILPHDEFTRWFAGFAPDLTARRSTRKPAGPTATPCSHSSNRWRA